MNRRQNETRPDGKSRAQQQNFEWSEATPLVHQLQHFPSRSAPQRVPDCENRSLYRANTAGDHETARHAGAVWSDLLGS